MKRTSGDEMVSNQYQEDTKALDDLWESMLASVDGDGSAAEKILKSGRPIYYREASTPPGLEIKEYPDGRRELVRFSREGDEVVGVL